ncbi:RNA polymerase sigma factor [Ammoniphilus sp. CFH 90114]|uniref:RNA polymerase sigma factor n=1 Tax=Ammoniphilus sp. CFH 90114 TaxID=2493665 RepID=UPI00100E43CF|nr:sigma-70 family RNA polymerase sigma factor [Ammoniphilus sp. CFH 90114]RXT07198.1 sigma-70 family RNA polymerase sigma factor [Ammoniphilus sp. CFH 90114]
MEIHDAEWLKERMNTLYRYLVKIGASPEDAKDIVQETVYKAFVYAETSEIKNPSSWLFKVALNLYYDLRKKQKRAVPFTLEPDDIVEEQLPEDILLTAENQTEVHQTLDELSPTYKHLLLLRYEMDMSYKEIAQSFDMKVEQVKTYLARAKKQFLKHYSGRS